MPSKEEHLDKELRNGDLESDLQLGGRFPDWATIVLFYRVLHLVDAYFADRGVHPRNHFARNDSVNRLLPEIARQYIRLLEASVQARYEPNGLVGLRQYQDARAWFENVERHVRPQL